MADTQTTLTYLDGYCERAGEAGLWAEPLNAITNLFFILAAVMAARFLLQSPRVKATQSIDAWLLIFSLIAIGIGSGLWHVFASHRTMLMDVIPITAFINIYLLACMRRFFGLAWWKVIGLWLAYNAVGVGAQFALPPDTLNGTIMYIPTYLTLALIAAALWVKDRATGLIFLKVVLVWTASLLFRTVDMDVCGTLPIGTHFLWHILNAWVLWRLLTALIAHSKKA